jgi:Flp pilus assembly protein TadD
MRFTSIPSLVFFLALFFQPQQSFAAADNSATETPAAAPAAPDQQLYEQGKALAEAAQYDAALAVLEKISRQDDPKVLNYIGYSHRKAGRLDIAIEIYKKALAIDPNFVQARAYLGEGFVASGMLDLAKAELAEIKERCGATCVEYTALAKSIAAAGG